VESVEPQVMEVVRAISARILNRLDEIILFHRLGQEHMGPIGYQVARVQKLLKDRKITLSDAAKRWLGRVGYDPVYGARPEARGAALSAGPAGRKLLAGDVPDGVTVNIDEGDGALSIAVV
jgi:ATP-dependent Clp protease ATP-binding subunit ClpB